MTEQTQVAPNEPVLNKKPFDPKGVMQRHSKPIVYGGFCLLVVIALLFSSHGKTSASTKQQAKQNSPQPLVQDNTENNVADLKSQLAHQQQTLDQATATDPSMVNATPAQKAAALGYSPTGQAQPCIPGQPCNPQMQGYGYTQQNGGGAGQVSPEQQEAQQLAAKERVQFYTDNAARLTKDLSRDVSKTTALELSQSNAEQQRGEAMTYRKEHAEGMQPYQLTSHVPPSIYATSIDRETVLTDLRWSQEQVKNGADPADVAPAITHRHLQNSEPDQNQRALVERYADRVAELAYKGPEMPVERRAAQLEPTAEEKRHWEPLIQSIGVEHAEPFAWRKEHAEIQSYRSDENRGWLHIDNHGQFFDRNAQPIDAQVALEPFGLSAAASRGNEQSAGISKGTPTDSGYGISL